MGDSFFFQANTVRICQGVRSLDWLIIELDSLRAVGKRIVSTNGCFDLIHPGHLDFLSEARQQGDLLVVLLNTDDSIRQIKGAGRPVMPEEDRAAILLGLRSVDYVVLFDDPLPSRVLDLLRPHIHCKAGDYTVGRLPEAAIVQQHGGQVRILPLRGAYSSSSIIERILKLSLETVTGVTDSVVSTEQVCQTLLSGSNVLRQTAYALQIPILQVAQRMTDVIQAGNKIMVCGNGGSAASAKHFTYDLARRHRRERTALSAIALTVDNSTLTATANDDGFEEVFSRQVHNLGRAGDLLVAISPSGNSPNILNAVKSAKDRMIWTVGMTGDLDSPLQQVADVCLQVPATNTSLVQQAHFAILHVICDVLENLVP